MPDIKKISFFTAACLILLGHLNAQVNLPKQREDVIAQAEAFLKTREIVIPDDKEALDPFLGNIPRNAPVVESAARADAFPAEADSADLLRRIALSINASGTAILGGNRFLLTPRQRYQVGATLVVKYNGRDYEVTLSDVTSTTFTIKRNNQTHTRAVKF